MQLILQNRLFVIFINFKWYVCLFFTSWNNMLWNNSSSSRSWHVSLFVKNFKSPQVTFCCFYTKIELCSSIMRFLSKPFTLTCFRMFKLLEWDGEKHKYEPILERYSKVNISKSWANDFKVQGKVNLLTAKLLPKHSCNVPQAEVYLEPSQTYVRL